MTEKITREMIERYFAAKEGRAPNPFPTLPGLNVTPCYVLHEHDLDALCTMALNWLAVQPRPIEDAPKDGTGVLAFIPNWNVWTTAFYRSGQWFAATGKNGFMDIPQPTIFTSLPEPKI